MAIITINTFQVYAGNSGTISQSTGTNNYLTGLNDTYTELAGGEDNQLTPGEFVDNTFNVLNTEIIGTLDFGGITFIVTRVVGGSGGSYVLESEANLPKSAFPSSFDTTLIDFTTPYGFVCFAAGTLITTPQAETTVETLSIGDHVRTADGEIVSVKWIGRQTASKILAGMHMQPVRIRAGALTNTLPHSDLTVTADHGMILDDLIINASALVNGTTIDFVPLAELPDEITYYHIETQAHDVILANGAPVETFVDAVTRARFDNYQDYLDLYGAERLIPEMSRPRISAQRLLPETIKARLGIKGEVIDWDAPLSA